jgi:hypothetical protein
MYVPLPALILVDPNPYKGETGYIVKISFDPDTPAENKLAIMKHVRNVTRYHTIREYAGETWLINGDTNLSDKWQETVTTRLLQNGFLGGQDFNLIIRLNRTFRG